MVECYDLFCGFFELRVGRGGGPRGDAGEGAAAKGEARAQVGRVGRRQGGRALPRHDGRPEACRRGAAGGREDGRGADIWMGPAGARDLRDRRVIVHETVDLSLARLIIPPPPSLRAVGFVIFQETGRRTKSAPS